MNLKDDKVIPKCLVSELFQYVIIRANVLAGITSSLIFLLVLRVIQCTSITD